MGVYAINGTVAGTAVTVKPGALPIKIISIAGGTGTLTITKYTGGGTLTGGTTYTPQSMRDGAAAALATGKSGVTAISGTGAVIGANIAGGYTPPASLILAAGSSTVISASSANASITIYFDELEIQPGY